MDGDTAVLDPVSTAEAGAATEDASPPEGAAPSPPTEKAGPEGTTETAEPYVSPYEGKDLGEVEKDPIIQKLLKDRESRMNESFRQREERAKTQAEDSERERSYKERQAQTQHTLRGDAVRRFLGIAKAIEDGTHEGNPAVVQKWVQDVSLELADAVFQQQHDTYVEAMRRKLTADFPDFKPTVDQQATIDRAARTYQPLEMVTSWLEVAKAAVVDDLSPKLRTQVAKELADKAKADGALEAERKAAAGRGDPASRPTNLSGKGGASGRYDLNTSTGLMQAKAAGVISETDARKRWSELSRSL